jgi:disulfide bond formation protein DsbB
MSHTLPLRLSQVMTRTRLTLFATAALVAVLLAGLAFQHIGGLAPCTLCYWQRYGHLGAAMLGGLALVLPSALLLFAAALAALATSGIAAYHTGVEQKWWQGPSSCSGTSIEGMTTEELMQQIMTAPVVRCDEISWQLFGLSMANYNVAISAGLALVFVLAARARP